MVRYFVQDLDDIFLVGLQVVVPVVLDLLVDASSYDIGDPSPLILIAILLYYDDDQKSLFDGPISMFQQGVQLVRPSLATLFS